MSAISARNVRRLIDATSVGASRQNAPSLTQINEKKEGDENNNNHNSYLNNTSNNNSNKLNDDNELIDSTTINFAPPITRIPRSLAAFNRSSHGNLSQLFHSFLSRQANYCFFLLFE